MNKKYLYIAFLQFLVLLSCKDKVEIHEKIISLNGLNRWYPNSSTYTSLEIMKVYPTKKECSYHRNFSNLYVCRTRLTNKIDTIYFFDECNHIIYSDSRNKEIGFFNSDTPRIIPKETIIFSADTFLIPKKAKYTFGKLSNFTEL